MLVLVKQPKVRNQCAKYLDTDIQRFVDWINELKVRVYVHVVCISQTM
jgi:hypothetical protein